jgi:hypothetical protein
METTCAFETSVAVHGAARLYVAEDGTFCRRLDLNDEQIGPLLTEQK